VNHFAGVSVAWAKVSWSLKALAYVVLFSVLVVGGHSLCASAKGKSQAPTVPVWSAPVAIGNDDICEVGDGSGDLESCAVQKERLQAQKAAAKEEQDKQDCRKRGCHIFRIDDCVGGICYTVYRTRHWDCVCKEKPSQPMVKPAGNGTETKK
jgi:hypothetical protein